MTNIDDFEPGDIIEFIYPASKGPQAHRFGVGTLTKVTKRKAGHSDIEIQNTHGKTTITEVNIRWDRTMFHKNKIKGST